MGNNAVAKENQNHTQGFNIVVQGQLQHMSVK
jgi:hypothetical protein